MSYLKISSLIVSALAAVVTSHAATQSFTASFGPANTDWTTTLSVAQFNPALGALTGIDWSVSGSIIAGGSTDTRVRAVADGTITVNKPGGGVLAVVLPSLNEIVSPGTFGPISASDSALGSVASVDFGPYIGNGSVSLGAEASGLSGYVGPGNVNFSIATQADAQLTITYTYTPPTTSVPDSGSTLGLLGAGVLLVGAIRRKCS